ncbi:MAG: hypothetical protein OEY86_14815 [Nitrospira sp.]|nr:hypothetical protein [Nitrospira sp.]
MGPKSEKEKELNQKRAAARAAAQIRRDILTIQADRMLTLTYRENMTDRKQTIADLAAFQRKVRKVIPNWASVAVLEYQKRGAAHWHLAIAGFVDVKVLRRLWREVVGEGNIDISFKRQGQGNHYSKLASYMGKYLSKGLDEGRQEGEHRYFRFHIGEYHKEVYYIAAHADVGLEREAAYEAIQAFVGGGTGLNCRIWLSASDGSSGGFAVGERTT